MVDHTNDDTFLSRWINDELSDEELREFKKDPDYTEFLKIKQGTEMLTLSEYDLTSALAAVKSHPKAMEDSKSVRKLWPYLAVAASILVIIGLFLFYPSSTVHSTGYGEIATVQLPDGSEMILNAQSNASFDSKKWEEHRDITLEGEAFFKVKKGSKFVVHTPQGTVTVLGTEFNVQSQGTLFQVYCYHGKVKVQHEQQEQILTMGKGFQKVKNQKGVHIAHKDPAPSWIEKTSSFTGIPLQYVVLELQEQYGIQIHTKDLDLTLLYTGTFPNDDMNTALQTVFGTLGASYQISEDQKTVVIAP